jgi:hypothetical protein
MPQASAATTGGQPAAHRLSCPGTALGTSHDGNEELSLSFKPVS